MVAIALPTSLGHSSTPLHQGRTDRHSATACALSRQRVRWCVRVRVCGGACACAAKCEVTHDTHHTTRDTQELASDDVQGEGLMPGRPAGAESGASRCLLRLITIAAFGQAQLDDRRPRPAPEFPWSDRAHTTHTHTHAHARTHAHTHDTHDTHDTRHTRHTRHTTHDT